MVDGAKAARAAVLAALDPSVDPPSFAGHHGTKTPLLRWVHASANPRGGLARLIEGGGLIGYRPSTSRASFSIDTLQPNSLSKEATPGGRFSCRPVTTVPS